MLKELFNPTVNDICPNCGQACATTDVLCPNCGENLDELFEQVPDSEVSPFTVIKFLKTLVVLLLGMLVPSASTIIAVYLTLTYGSLYDSGIFIRWHSLGSPPEKVTKLLGICDYYELCVQTESNKIYEFNTDNCNASSQSCWKQVDQPLIEEPPFNESCWFEFAKKNPPKGVIQSMQTNDCDPAVATLTKYVLLADGQVWIWKDNASDLQGFLWLFYAIPVAIFSFIGGVVVVIKYTPRIWKKWITTIP